MEKLTLEKIIKNLNYELSEQDQKNLETMAVEIVPDIDDLLTDDPDLLISDDNPYK